MIKVILVDDEKPALRMLEFLLKKFDGISIEGVYTNPLKAIEEIEEIKPQAVFLDINMPQLQGIDVASRILDIGPDTDIIFITAFDEYAVEAFELHALDYLLKPVDPERMKKTIERLMKKTPCFQESTGRKLRIKCLGQFEVVLENQEPIKWRAEKTSELFAFLLHDRGRNHSKEEMLDKLWSEVDPEKSVKQLYNGIYYIRKALEAYGIGKDLIRIGSNYSLKLGDVELDVESFYELEKSDSSYSIEVLEEMEALYKGDYLAGENYPWADFERERLSRLYQQCLIQLAAQYIEKGQFGKAETKLQIAYHKNPYEEKITDLLLRLYKETGEKGKAVRHYNSYAKLLKEELGVEPGVKRFN